MDTKILIEKLNGIFCETNRKEARYARIWLTEADFGGLYHSDLYILNVKAEHHIDSCSGEIMAIISLLKEKANEELKLIYKVIVFNENEQVHCESEDLVVFDESKRCSPLQPVS